MLTLEELQKTNPKIFIGLPCYGGMISENVFHSLLSLQLWGMKNNIHFRTQTMGNESLITRARNTIVSMMLDDTNFVATHLLFVDADIGFQPENIQRLLLADKDVACGIYPRKCIHWEKTIQAMKENPDITEQNLFAKSLGYNLNFDDPQNVQVVDGFCKVQEAATGMMLVKREVFRTMKKSFLNVNIILIKLSMVKLLNQIIVMTFFPLVFMERKEDTCQKIIIFQDYGKSVVERYGQIYPCL